ncbi:MAG: ectoine/hydroxyectoine ABC transporter substrate-binding protein EhuB [Chloroflexi bacterium]|nr:ectoine/hydroxyectoine ABC transporter substrate-binding protein EhuB [Chloroflexota bacterium]
MYTKLITRFAMLNNFDCANDVPYAYVDADGKLTGEAPKVARVVLANMGIDEIEGVYTEFGSLISGLKAGHFDMIAAGMFITPERCQEIAFSEPTYQVGQGFLVQAGNPQNLHSYEDVVNDPDVVLAVMAGAVEGNYARAVGIPESQIVTVPDPPTGLIAVKLGQADAMALTSLAVDKLAKTDQDRLVEQAQPFTNPVIDGKAILGYGAFGFRLEDGDLVQEFNRYLTSFIGTQEHMELVRPFGFTEFPGDDTADKLCSSD